MQVDGRDVRKKKSMYYFLCFENYIFNKLHIFLLTYYYTQLYGVISFFYDSVHSFVFFLHTQIQLEKLSETFVSSPRAGGSSLLSWCGRGEFM